VDIEDFDEKLNEINKSLIYEFMQYLQSLELDPLGSAPFISILLTIPELHCNTARIETLLHIILAEKKGKNIVSLVQIQKLFLMIGKTSVGWMEDPAEDVFIYNVLSPKGNYRIFEGIWEGNGYHLQRFIDLFSSMHSNPVFKEIQDSCYALLKLSESVADRCHQSRC